MGFVAKTGLHIGSSLITIYEQQKLGNSENNEAIQGGTKPTANFSKMLFDAKTGSKVTPTAVAYILLEGRNLIIVERGSVSLEVFFGEKGRETLWGFLLLVDCGISLPPQNVSVSFSTVLHSINLKTLLGKQYLSGFASKSWIFFPGKAGCLVYFWPLPHFSLILWHHMIFNLAFFVKESELWIKMSCVMTDKVAAVISFFMCDLLTSTSKEYCSGCAPVRRVKLRRRGGRHKTKKTICYQTPSFAYLEHVPLWAWSLLLEWTKEGPKSTLWLMSSPFPSHVPPPRRLIPLPLNGTAANDLAFVAKLSFACYFQLSSAAELLHLTLLQHTPASRSKSAAPPLAAASSSGKSVEGSEWFGIQLRLEVCGRIGGGGLWKTVFCQRRQTSGQITSTMSEVMVASLLGVVDSSEDLFAACLNQVVSGRSAKQAFCQTTSTHEHREYTVRKDVSPDGSSRNKELDCSSVFRECTWCSFVVRCLLRKGRTRSSLVR